MNTEKLTDILTKVAANKISIKDAAKLFENFTFEDIEFANIDHHRSIRKGFPEVIFGAGKTARQTAGIIEKMILNKEPILVTKVEEDKAKFLCLKFKNAVYHKDAKMIVICKRPHRIKGKGTILVLSAGTSDIPIAKEAIITAEIMGNKTDFVFDVGVAGIHRLFARKDIILKASVIIVAAGMEGALPSVVAGMVKAPVIGLPTDIGYGTSFGGLTALFGMLNSCSSNITVVNINNGFGAGYAASCMNRL
ncbi:MAG: nickel pincer cofactor biosynthesis protein LarB [Deltaproteobacteria bacterium]|nr:nickel pincer cofactor biosynthesis protein LarB [Deltaproteobacteria bacterium]